MVINGIISSLKEVTCGRLHRSLQGSLHLINLKMELPVKFLGQQEEILKSNKMKGYHESLVKG